MSQQWSCGFQPYSYRDFIKQLRQLLQDRYTWDGDAFTIFKELIQNANDACATSLHLGWSPPLFDATTALNSPRTKGPSSKSHASHPLLTVPALFAVNNGPLKKSDAINITRLGSNSKAGEASSAGRFGLGLKSVFHLCEAFFFLARPFEGDDSLCSLFSPWSPPRGTDEVGPYAHWDFDPFDKVSQQVEAAIRSRLEPILGKTLPSFCLWIPLRDRQVLKGDPLINRFLTGNELSRVLCDRTLHLRLAELLPLLHSLSEISVWLPNPNAAIQLQFSVSVNSSSTRPAKLPEPVDEKLPSARQTPFSGEVIVHGFDTRAETSCKFVGAEAIVASDSIHKLWINKNWPPDESLDPLTNQWRSHRVKLVPHGALRFMATPKAKSTGRVAMHWCVFLPLGKNDGDEHHEVETSLEWDVSVFLHGYFFIDAGRTRHVTNESGSLAMQQLDAEGLQKSWNAVVEREAVWPQFLDAFAAFVAAMNWDEQQVEKLTEAMRTHLLNVLPIVCGAKQWLYLVKPPTKSSKSLGQWTLKTAKAVVHEIPRPSGCVALYDILPGIADVGSERALTFADRPRISANEATPWAPTTLAKVVGSLKSDVAFKSDANLVYVARFLKHCARNEDQKQAVGEALWPLLKKAFQDDSLTLQRIEELGDKLLRVLEFVPEEHRLALSWANSKQRGADAVFRLIAKDECDLLPIPSSVEPNGSDCRQLESLVVVRLLKAIADESPEITLLADVVGDLLKRADRDRETLWQSLKDVRLLVVYERGQEQPTRKTWVELYEHKRQRLVFCDQECRLIKPLQAAIGDAGSVWRIEPKFAAKVLGDNHGLPECVARECAAVLAPTKHGDGKLFGGAALGAWESRRELLTKLVGTLGTGAPDEQERLKDACRLLIHGRSSDADFNAALFLAGDNQKDVLATKLVRHVLEKRGEEWRVLEGEVATWALNEGLTVKHRELLSLTALTLNEPLVLGFLQRASDEQLRGLAVTPDEYVQLFETLDASRDDLLKRLPIHPIADTKSKKRAAISTEAGKAYWDDGYQLDQELITDITLFALDRRSKIAERQKRLMQPLNHVEAIRLVLKSEQPHRHWETILRAVEKSDEPLPSEVVAALKTKAWLPSQFVTKVCNHLICLTLTGQSKPGPLPDELTQAVTRLVEKCEGYYLADWQLDPQFLIRLQDPRTTVCQRLRTWEILPDEPESLKRLSELLDLDEENRIGDVPLDHFPDWMAIDWDASVMPAHQILKPIAELERVGPDSCFEHASAAVRKPIEDHDRLIRILNWLADHHRQLNQKVSPNSPVFRIFGLYWRSLSASGDICSSMCNVVFAVAASGEWQRTAELCICESDSVIERRHILHKCLGEDFPKSPGYSSACPTSTAGREFETVLKDWEPYVPRHVFGGFLAVLGVGYNELAEKYLSPRTVHETRTNIFGQLETRQRKEAISQIGKLQAEVEVLPGKAVSMRNLADEVFNAPLIDSSDLRLVPSSDGRDIHFDANALSLSLRIHAGSPSYERQERAIEFFKGITESVLLKVLSSFHFDQIAIRSGVHQVFDDLASASEMEIIFLQHWICDNSESQLREVCRYPDLQVAEHSRECSTWRDQINKNRVNHEKFNTAKPHLDFDENERFRSAKRKLRDALENDTNSQLKLLDIRRRKVKEYYQYSQSSVLFELFQNADDAYLELGDSYPDAMHAFYFATQSRRVGICHFGRRINVAPESCDPSQAAAYKHDLRNMLSLDFSDKDVGTVDVSAGRKRTGKFGLGFKSVFLATDSPRIQSGELRCEIRGGLFPVPIRSVDAAFAELRHYYKEFRLDRDRERLGTVIDLPLSDVDSVAQIRDRFINSAHILVVFARQIRRVVWSNEGANAPVVTDWQETAISGMTNCFRGTLRALVKSSCNEANGVESTNNSDTNHAIVLSLNNHNGALLLVHDGRVFQRLAKEVPTLWVTAPTREALDVGFALNAHFSLDPGRAQLGWKLPENTTIAIELGHEFGQRFLALRDLSEKSDWAGFLENIGFDRDADEYEFWSSLWKLLGGAIAKLDETTSSSGLLRQVFWGTECGAARHLFSQKDVLANGLPGELQSLTRVSNLKYEITGSLAHKEVLPKVAQWDGWKKKHISPAECAVRDVLQVLDKFEVRSPQLKLDRVISLETVLRWECEFDCCLSRERAAGISAVIFNKHVKEELNQFTAAGAKITEALAGFQFPDANGVGRAPKELIVSWIPADHATSSVNDLGDEVLMARFAPSDRVLNREFLTGTSTTDCLRLFVECRGSHRPSASQLASWAIDARDAEQKAAVKAYLAKGKGRDGLIETLRSREAEVRTSWLAGLLGKKILQTASEREEDVTQELDDPIPPPPPEPDHARSVLEKIYEWWDKERGRHLRNYEERTFPEGGLLYLNRANNHDDELFRKDWVTLFLLGLAHTMGRQTAEQHRDFIRKCEHDGTLRMIAASEREPSAWMGWIDDFLDRQLEDSKFLQWMKQFVGIYQVSRHLEDYIAAFESVDSEDFKTRQFGLLKITNLRSSPQFSGSDFDAPPLARVLGMGQCFVLRELVRNGVLTNSQAFRHCYVPTKRVRDLLTDELGCQGLGQQSRKWELSEHIYEFLDEHLGKERSWFHHCFDLPLQIIAGDEGLQARFFGKQFTFTDDDSDLWYPDAEEFGEA